MNNRYAVTRTGKIISKYRGTNKPLSEHIDDKGYHRVTLTVAKGKKRTLLVHRLIAKALIPNPDNKPQVNHKDGNKSNNSVENLEWVTGQENVDHSVNAGLVQRGIHRPNARLSDDQVRIMRKKREEGASYYVLGREFNVAYQTAHKVCTRQTYTHVI